MFCLIVFAWLLSVPALAAGATPEGAKWEGKLVF